jgi:hypothetical protein
MVSYYVNHLSGLALEVWEDGARAQEAQGGERGTTYGDLPRRHHLPIARVPQEPPSDY